MTTARGTPSAPCRWNQRVRQPQPGQSAPGTVVRGDFLSQLLHQGEISWGMMLIGMAVAFGLGAMHALSPGHGKTIVAAYLVGSRGTPKHAIFLGGMVTFTHTISVFFLGIVTLFLSQYVLPEKIYPVLGAISGMSIVWIGAMLFFRRLRLATGHAHHHHDHGSSPRSRSPRSCTITATAPWSTITATGTSTATCRKARSAWAA